MAKLDLKREMKHLYKPSARAVAVVDVPRMNFLMIDGMGDPNTAPQYAQAVEALYSAAYTLKFNIKKGPTAVDFAVMPLEGLWWVEDMRLFSAADKSAWLWTMMILQPDFVTEAHAAEAVAAAQRKKDLPALGRVRFEAYAEGPSVQILHIGPYAAEAPNIAKLHDYIAAQGWQRAGKHHEIYLSDPRRAAPEKLQTVIRQPYSA